MVSIVDEKSLVDLCRKKNRQAQKLLFDTYFKKMMPICLRYLKNESDSLEVMNTAFLKVFDKIADYKAEGRLESWIKRIVINTTIDYIRSHKAYKEQFIHTNEFHLYGEPVEETDSSDVVDDYPDFSKEEIFDMVATLPPATRVVFNLFVIDEFSHKQICEQLKISTGTSKWHLSNARTLLKEKINQAGVIKRKNVNHG